MKTKQIRENKYLGFTLIEIVIVLAIAAGLIAVVFSQASKSKAKSQVNQMRNNLTDLKTGIQSLYQNDPNKYTNITISDIVQAGVVPTNLTSTTTAITDQFGQLLQIDAGTGGNYFVITYQQVSTEVCIGLLTSIVPDTFSGITINGMNGPEMISDGTISGLTAHPKMVSNLAITNACTNGPVAMNFYSN